MSDHHIVVIPADPWLIPSIEQSSALVALLKQWMPDADAISAEFSENIEFRDCGESFEYVACPACNKTLDIAQWHELMDNDYDIQHGFQLNTAILPCCGHAAAVHQLTYSFTQGFSRFSLIAENPQISPLTEQQIDQLQQVLGSGVIVIYRHI